MSDIIASGFLSRNIVEYLTADKSVRQYRCNTLQNPLAYYDGEQFRPVSIMDVADTYSANGEGIYLRDKSIVSVGIKQADDAYKFIGLRPDEKQDGSEQLEFSLEAIEVNGKSQTINLSTKTALSSISTNIGPLVVQSRRQGCRIILPLTNADDGFKMSLRLHLTGMTVEYIESLDEYWIFNERGRFRFRFGKPYLVGLDGDPIQWPSEEFPSRPNLVSHSLKDNGDGTFIYTKGPGPDFGKVTLPERSFVDADIVYSATTDGFVYHENAVWATLHDAATGTSVDTTSSSINGCPAAGWNGSTFIIRRCFFSYNLSTLSGTVTNVSEKIYGYNGDDSACVQKANYGTALATADYDAFSGVYYAKKTVWDGGNYNTFSYNATGIADVEAAVGVGSHQSCLREYAHDYLDASPGTSMYANGCYFANNTGTTYDPYLSITLTVSTTYTKTASLDALIQKAGITKTVSLDALLQKTITATASLDALLQKARTASVGLDALLRAAKTGGIGIDALVRMTRGQTLSLDALVQEVKSGTLSLDAFVQIVRVAGIGLDALVAAPRDVATGLDAILAAAPAGATVSLDALLQAAKSGAINLDALIVVAGQQTVSLDALLQTVRTGAVSLDALISLSGRTRNAQLDALLLAVRTRMISLDAVLLATRLDEVSLDALISLARTRGVSLDAILAGGAQAGLSLDAIVAALKCGAVRLDALLAAAGGAGVSLDALLVPEGYVIHARSRIAARPRVARVEAAERTTSVVAPVRCTSVVAPERVVRGVAPVRKTRIKAPLQ